MTRDPILTIRERVRTLQAAHSAADEADADEVIGRLIDTENQALITRPVTAAGAIAALEWATAEAREWYVHQATREDNLILALIGGAADYLRERPIRRELVTISDGISIATQMVECARMAAHALGDGEPIATVLDEAVSRLKGTQGLLAAVADIVAEHEQVPA